MRQPRIKVPDQTAVYHCISRCVGNQFLLDDVDKEQLRLMLWQQADFCGIQVITYGILDNHFHVEVRIQPQGQVADTELLRRAEGFYPAKNPLLQRMRKELDQEGALSNHLRQKLLRRMGDVSAFMKELKQGFSRWYNRRHERFGTLWAERFRSVLVQDHPEVVRIMALYIDLNPVRAGLVSDPKEYRFCGYAEAVVGNEWARAGLLRALGGESWATGGPEYRQLLFLGAGTAGQSGKAVLDRETILRVLREGGQISCEEALRLRIRYFSDGLVFGMAPYVEEIFRRYRGQFGKTRRTGSRKLRGLPFDQLRTLRDLRVDPVS
jgi:REP element-mobilizing transposase RayT